MKSLLLLGFLKKRVFIESRIPDMAALCDET